jgi:hypothetical protein
MLISGGAETPFVRNLVAKFGTSSSYVRDLVALEAALREGAHEPGLERRYPLEALIIRNELASGRATTRGELSLLETRAAEFSARTALDRRPRRPNLHITDIRRGAWAPPPPRPVTLRPPAPGSQNLPRHSRKVRP